MTVGIVMLTHGDLARSSEVARYWATSGCPVVIHVDKRVEQKPYAAFVQSLSDLDNVLFSKRHRCEWGAWSLVQASQTASELILREFKDIQHVYLASGTCLPLRPVSELVQYLEERPRTDFIESATTNDVPWTVGGLDEERFTLRFPFSWRRHRKLFDGYVKLQRRIGVKRRIPMGLVPHMGSQWWCLTRHTLSAILEDPQRDLFDKYFSKVWIPDESYYQTLARLYSHKIESRSLTLSKFDFQGKPHIFYDDHLQLLRRSDCFVARKIWPDANMLYDVFLHQNEADTKRAAPTPSKIDRIFSKAIDRRTKGRAGLVMQSRHPNHNWENGMTCAPYGVVQGLTELFHDFEPWLSRACEAEVHGHLFSPTGVEFLGDQDTYGGCLYNSLEARDYNPKAFLRNLIWNTRGKTQCFQFGPDDTQDITWMMAGDPNASISIVSGAWAVPLFNSNRNFSELRKEAARLQKIEAEHIKILTSHYSKARVNIWTMAEFIEAPMEPLQTIIDSMGARSKRRLTEAPRMVDLTGFGQFLQNLKNQGMHPYLMGDFPVGNDPKPNTPKRRKPYLVK